MNDVSADVRKSVHKYLAAVKKQYPIREAYLFGSQAAGRAHEWSDIDLALISPAFAKDPIASQFKLMQIAARIDWRIEPHVFAPSDFEINHPLVPEIQRNGVSLIAKRAPSQKRK